MIKKIPVYEPVLNQSAKTNVMRCLDSNWISSRGEFIEKFEDEFAHKVGASHAATASNGTVALHLALLALDIGPGDEVIVPTFTYIASVNAIAYVGAIPVFCDSSAHNWQIDPLDVERRITPKTRAIMVVHLYGQPSDMRAIQEIARRHKLKIIEDAAESFGSYIGKSHVGSFGDVGTFSFFGNKTITTGEGGMVVTNDSALDLKVRKLRGQGLEGKREYWHDEIGYNYRMTNICAAIGLAQLQDADLILARKREIATQYRDELSGLPLEFLWETSGTTNSFWMNCVAVEDESKRDDLRNFLSKEGIETRPTFYPAHTMPMYEKFGNNDFPTAIHLAARGINLPSSPALSDGDIAYVVEKVKIFFNNRMV